MGSSNGFMKQTTLIGQSPKTTPFYLVRDRENQYKYDQRVERSIDFSNMIPFLRTTDDSRVGSHMKVKRAYSTGKQSLNTT